MILLFSETNLSSYLPSVNILSMQITGIAERTGQTLSVYHYKCAIFNYNIMDPHYHIKILEEVFLPCMLRKFQIIIP